jgi:hypothetical protein
LPVKQAPSMISPLSSCACVAEHRRTTSGTHRCIWQRRTGTRTS